MGAEVVVTEPYDPFEPVIGVADLFVVRSGDAKNPAELNNKGLCCLPF